MEKLTCKLQCIAPAVVIAILIKKQTKEFQKWLKILHCIYSCNIIV